MTFEVIRGEEQLSEHLMNLARLDGMIELCGVLVKRLVADLSVVPPIFAVVHEAHVEVPPHTECRR